MSIFWLTFTVEVHEALPPRPLSTVAVTEYEPALNPVPSNVALWPEPDTVPLAALQVTVGVALSATALTESCALPPDSMSTVAF